MSEPAPFSALLLAGGRSKRMGRDKALLPHPVSGLPLIAHQAALLRSLPGCAELLLSAPADRAYPLTGPLANARLVPDTAPDSGPLAGLAAGLAAATHPRLLVLAVDLPFLSADWLRLLLVKASPSIGSAPQHANQSFEPLCAVYPVNAVSRLATDDALRGNQLSLQRLLHTATNAGWMAPLLLSPEELRLFANWNTPADVRPHIAPPQ